MSNVLSPSVDSVCASLNDGNGFSVHCWDIGEAAPICSPLPCFIRDLAICRIIARREFLSKSEVASVKTDGSAMDPSIADSQLPLLIGEVTISSASSVDPAAARCLLALCSEEQGKQIGEGRDSKMKKEKLTDFLHFHSF